MLNQPLLQTEVTDACENITFPRTTYVVGKYGVPLIVACKDYDRLKRVSTVIDMHRYTFHEDFGIRIFGQIVGVDKRWIIRIGGSQTDCSFASWMKQSREDRDAVLGRWFVVKRIPNLETETEEFIITDANSIF